MGILGAILGKRDAAAAYRTVDGGHPAPYPDMTDEQLYNYEVAFNIPKRTFDRPPVSARASVDDTRAGRRYASTTHAFASAHAATHERDREPSLDPPIDEQPAKEGQRQEPQWRDTAVQPPHAQALDLSKPVRTITTKQPVEIVTTKARHPVYKVHGYIGDDSVLTVFTADGRLSENGAQFLENTPDQEHLHLNIYRNPDPQAAERYVLTQHASAEDAQASARQDRLASVKVQFDR